MNITTSAGIMKLPDSALPSVDDMNDIIDATVEAHNPATAGMSEDAAEEQCVKNGDLFQRLCDASTGFDPHLTNEQFHAACVSWLKAND